MQSRSFIRSLMVSMLTASFAVPSLVQAMPADKTRTETYGKSGDWTLRRTIANGNEIVSCDMFNIQDDENGLRFYYDASGGSLGFSGHGANGSEEPLNVEIWFDGKRGNSQVLSMALLRDSEGFPWRSYSAPNTEPDGILDDMVHVSKEVSFGYVVPDDGEHIETFPLRGYAAAAQKTTECINGPNDTSSAEATPASEAADADKSTVIKGTCRLVVDGKTYINIKKTCPIWMAHDGTGAFWINTDRDTYLGDYFAEVTPDGKGAASGHWNGLKGATHAQAFLGEDFKQGKGGCWSNRRATICAAK